MNPYTCPIQCVLYQSAIGHILCARCIHVFLQKVQLGGGVNDDFMKHHLPGLQDTCTCSYTCNILHGRIKDAYSTAKASTVY